MAKLLAQNKCNVIILDNLSTGFEKSAKYGRLVVGDLADIEFIDELFNKNIFDGVIHFAASSIVGESIVNPAKYYRNNISNTINLLDVMVRHNVKNFIFSSTAAIYGEPNSAIINENHLKNPINPYGSSKMMIEHILKDYASAYDLNSISLRYFNACGADPDGELGECHSPETHLIPLILQAASGRRESITVFGRDYDTSDGTCIRDYIHINDLCSAHALALDKIISAEKVGALSYNLGNSSGFSVQQVIDVVQAVVAVDNCSLKVVDGERRAGDPAILVADSSKAKEELGWTPEFNKLEVIVNHAWAWEKKLANIS
jgi:UDP-glucose 4-epimerase